MAKQSYKCSSCEKKFSKWYGICPACKGDVTEYESFSPVDSKKAESTRAGRLATNNSPQPISKVADDKYERFKTGVSEFDRVLGGGLVPGGVVLMAGAPGVGKSSLVLLAGYELAKQNKKVLLVSGEETTGQIAARAKRVKAINDNLWLLAESNIHNIQRHIHESKPDVIIIDSIQTMLSEESDGGVGSISQLKEAASALVNTAKILNTPMLLIGHLTKDDKIAGPRQVEHLVDAVLYFEGSKDSGLRLLRGIKNRYGAVDEIGCFEHTSEGLIEVKDPSGMFLSEHEPGTTGYATSIIVEGNRALPIEVTALVSASTLPNPRKISHGLDHGRVLMIQAILEKYARVNLSNKDVYVSTTGGLQAKDTSIDLAIAAALLSSMDNSVIPEHTVFLGETALTGEVRPPRDLSKRVAEAQRLGYKNIVMSKSPVKDKAISNIIDLSTMLKNGR